MLTVSGLCTDYPGEHGKAVRAADEVSFEVPKGRLFTLLGPSGCGKTTTLRSIAGLERPRLGEIAIGGELVYSSRHKVFVPPNRRGLGMVFQSYAIWPHMTVFENAAFPLRVSRKRISGKGISQKVSRVLEVVDLGQLADREATRLSGGQQQRLALARALVMEPRVLLLDEPLSNLDAKLRQKMRFELKRLQQELGITTVYVTHDQSEALALSHEIAVMNEGRIVQLGTPREIYDAPRNRFVADFVGTTNFLEGEIAASAGDQGRYTVRTPVGEFSAQASGVLRAGDPIVLSVRPEDIQLYDARPDANGGSNVCEGVIEARVFLGECVDLGIRLGGRTLFARGHPSLRAGVGEAIFLRLNPEKCIALSEAPR